MTFHFRIQGVEQPGILMTAMPKGGEESSHELGLRASFQK